MGKCKVPIIGGGGKSEGLNVWQKYDNYTPAKTMGVSFKGITGTPSDEMIQLNGFKLSVSEGFTLEDLTLDMLVGHIPVNYYVNQNRRVKIISTTQYQEQYYDETYRKWSDMGNNPYTYNKGNGTITLGGYVYMHTGAAITYHNLNVTFPEVKGNLIGFVTSDDPSAYPDGAVHTDGYYYELFGQVTSANVMSLSDNAVATVQQDYRNTIETEVSNANS